MQGADEHGSSACCSGSVDTDESFASFAVPKAITVRTTVVILMHPKKAINPKDTNNNLSSLLRRVFAPTIDKKLKLYLFTGNHYIEFRLLGPQMHCVSRIQGYVDYNGICILFILIKIRLIQQ